MSISDNEQCSTLLQYTDYMLSYLYTTQLHFIMKLTFTHISQVLAGIRADTIFVEAKVKTTVSVSLQPTKQLKKISLLSMLLTCGTLRSHKPLTF
jgi:hypothetical protein